MSDMVLASKGYVGTASGGKDYYEAHRCDDSQILPSPTIVPLPIKSYCKNEYKVPAKSIMTITHIMVKQLTIPSDNLYVGYARGNGMFAFMPDEPFQAGIAKNIALRYMYPLVFKNDTNRDTYYTKNPEEDGLGSFTTSGTRWYFYTKNEDDSYTSVSAIDKTEVRTYLAGMINGAYDVVNSQDGYSHITRPVDKRYSPHWGWRYTIAPISDEMILSSTAYANSKFGLPEGDDSLASKEYVDSKPEKQWTWPDEYKLVVE